MSIRASWDDYFLSIADVVRRRSSCLRRSVGGILVRDKRILTTGYNGPPRGMAHCDELGGCIREKLGIPSGQRTELCRAVHAEANAIVQAAIHGIAIEGSTLYCTTAPCSGCAKLLISAGIVRIVYAEDYPDEFGASLLKEAGVKTEKWIHSNGTEASVRCDVQGVRGSDNRE